MRDLWKSDNWNKYIDTNDRKDGLYLRFEKGIDTEYKRVCKDFCKWLKKQYYFPVKIIIYIKKSEYVLTMDSQKCSAVFWGPYDKKESPNIKIATGDVKELIEERGKDNALTALIGSIIHELSHYFQWIKNIDKNIENQCNYYRREILYDYAETREHP